LNLIAGLVWTIAEVVIMSGILFNAKILNSMPDLRNISDKPASDDAEYQIPNVRSDTTAFFSNRARLCIIVVVSLSVGVCGYFVHGNVSNVFDEIKLAVALIGLSVAMVTDYTKYVVPNILLIGMLVIGIIISVPELILLSDDRKTIIVGSLLGIGVSFIVLALISLITKGGLGMGDVKLISTVGFLSGLYAVVGVLIVSLLLITVVALVLIALKKKNIKDKMPFAPFTFWGLVVVLVIGLF
jgi:prepilin signal peptidase PulO-like enzyme (type II secretory pathway)